MRIPAILLALVVTFGAIAQVYELSEVDTAPIFAKGKMKSQDFLRLYQTYPETAYNANIQGTVKLEYIVNTAGEVSNIQIKEGLNETLNNEALRVAKLLPYYTPAYKNGEPVSVRLEFPIIFTKEISKVAKNPVVENKDNSQKNPLYVVNGKILEKNQNLNPENIKKIRIIKGTKAINLYGARAKDGIVMIETK